MQLIFPVRLIGSKILIGRYHGHVSLRIGGIQMNAPPALGVKEFIDELRRRNGNLNIPISREQRDG